MNEFNQKLNNNGKLKPRTEIQYYDEEKNSTSEPERKEMDDAKKMTPNTSRCKIYMNDKIVNQNNAQSTLRSMKVIKSSKSIKKSGKINFLNKKNRYFKKIFKNDIRQ